MTTKKSLSDRFIEKAFSEGYYATEDGKVFSNLGVELKTSSSKSGHLRTTLYVDGLNKRGSCSVLVHRMVMYHFAGDELFEHYLVRHLNDIPWDNRIENLKLGSAKDNRADIGFERLSEIAKKHAPDFVARMRKLSDDDIRKMRKVRKEKGTPYKKLGEMFGVTTMTAHRACNGKAWNNIKEED